MFCTAINCMDGRVQSPVAKFMKKRFGMKYVDTVTEAGPVKILADQAPPELLNSIMKRLEISVGVHESRAIAIVGHHDCAGNPVPREKQLQQLQAARKVIVGRFPEAEVILLWVDEQWNAVEVPVE